MTPYFASLAYFTANAPRRSAPTLPYFRDELISCIILTRCRDYTPRQRPFMRHAPLMLADATMTRLRGDGIEEILTRRAMIERHYFN